MGLGVTEMLDVGRFEKGMGLQPLPVEALERLPKLRAVGHDRRVRLSGWDRHGLRRCYQGRAHAVRVPRRDVPGQCPGVPVQRS